MSIATVKDGSPIITIGFIDVRSKRTRSDLMKHDFVKVTLPCGFVADFDTEGKCDGIQDITCFMCENCGKSHRVFNPISFPDLVEPDWKVEESNNKE